MAMLYANTVWDGKSEIFEPKPTYEQGARGGHYFKGFDTGDTYHRVSGS